MNTLLLRTLIYFLLVPLTCFFVLINLISLFHVPISDECMLLEEVRNYQDSWHELYDKTGYFIMYPYYMDYNPSQMYSEYATWYSKNRRTLIYCNKDNKTIMIRNWLND